MTVLVADARVHESRLPKGSGSDSVAGAILKIALRVARSADVAGAGKAAGIARASGGMFL